MLSIQQYKKLQEYKELGINVQIRVHNRRCGQKVGLNKGAFKLLLDIANI
ncbi:hypothetical protein [Haploplasma modicum]|nr:hypothetical protein [Haploplasma modicum]